ncbi:hypothetical protein LS482_20905 [Sinomicrobium kalidii]|uniref:hypothetical protein n=1 Tax=Sinomicrobium kalidii TaxID=2900738 RepID=UPI001E39F0C7|nr:hypothetical protein [Sinomicrobium kalidii]UGU16124.1 hypothetical protein LS482_20905 [Sinomicrobium kalidii]
MKFIKAILLFILIVIFSFLGYQYYQYTALQKFIKNNKNSPEGFNVTERLSSWYNSFGEVWPSNKTELDSMLQEIRKYYKTDKLYLEKYGYNLQVDTVIVDTDTLKYTNIAYKLYSYGPDKKDDNLKNTPFNDTPLEYAPILGEGGIPIKDISFMEYLFMDKNFDIVLLYSIAEYNCNFNKFHYVDGPKRKGETFYLGGPGIKLKEGVVKGTTYDEHSEKFNQTLQTIQEALAEQYPDMPTEGLIFNYNGKRVRCICSFDISNAPITTIEKILTEKLNATTDYIDMAAFYMEVPVLE